MAKRKAQILNLFKCVMIALSLIAAVEYFKYGTQINYEWFHCTPIKESVGGPGSSVLKLSSQGGPSCDKRGEFKTIVKRISRDYEPNLERVSFCIIEDTNVPPVHYPVHEDKGAPGYFAYVGYNKDYSLVEELCGDAAIYHI